jgi:NitT/TauT family transport system ATP-binding protein
MKKTKKATAIPVLPNARVGSIVGLLEMLNEQGTRTDIYKLSESLRMELGEFIPITEAGELLGFVKIASGDIELADIGRKVIDGDENAKKAIFRQQMLANVLLAQRVRSDLQQDPEHRVGREVILEFLGSSFPPEESDRQAKTVIDWARYAELFDFDPETDQFFLPETAEIA